MRSEFPLSPLHLPRFYFCALLSTSHRSPLSERLEQASTTVVRVMVAYFVFELLFIAPGYQIYINYFMNVSS